MEAEQIISEIKKGVIRPLYILHGEEPYYIDQVAGFIEDHILDESEKAFNQVVLYGKETDHKTVVDEARQYPMLARFRVILIKEAQDMKSLPELASYLEHLSPTTVLVICYKYKKLDKRTRFSKLAEEKGMVFESKKLYDNQIPGWITQHLTSAGLQPDVGVSDLLSEYLGADLSKISNELSKLALTLGQTKKVTQDDVRNLIGISKEYDVFEFQKVLGMRNFTKANLMIRYFAANPASNPIVMLIANLFAYFNKVAVIKYHQSASDAELAKMAGVTPYYIKDYKSAASHYSFSHLRHIFYTLKEADKMSKGVGSRHADESSILKDILIACMQENRLA